MSIVNVFKVMLKDVKLKWENFISYFGVLELLRKVPKEGWILPFPPVGLTLSGPGFLLFKGQGRGL